jgi:transposase-like protein
LITRGEPRRRWPLEQRQAIAAESFQSGVSPTAVARRYGISSGLLYAWRKQGMEDLEQSVAEQMAGQEAATAPAAAEAQRAPKPAKRNRGALPAHLPRVELVVDVEDQTCPCCGARLRPWRSVACFWQEGFGAALRVRTDAATLLRRHVFIDTMNFHPVLIRAAVDLLGADHVLSGSDWPIVSEDPIRERAEQAFIAAALTSAEQTLIAGGNTKRLLGI